MVAALACGGDDEFADSSSCASGLVWVGGDEGSARMHPGGDCIGCHVDRGEGPVYEIAGTVYEAIDEEDDCRGLKGAVVELVDVNDNTFTMTSNSSGNFFMTAEEAASIEYPAYATVTLEGRTSVMLGPVPYGNCVDCHTRNGNWTSPGGRIYVP